MSTRLSPFARNSIGFIVGGIVSAVAAGLIFVSFFPLPKEHDPRNHTGEAFIMTVLVMFFCGGFIGRRGFSAEALSDFLPSVIGTYVLAFVLPLLAGLSFCEVLPLLGFASAGVAASVVGSLLLMRFFPVRAPDVEG